MLNVRKRLRFLYIHFFPFSHTPQTPSSHVETPDTCTSQHITIIVIIVTVIIVTVIIVMSRSRQEIMDRVEQSIEEYMEEILDAGDETAEERRLIKTSGDTLEEDEDYLYNLERRRVMMEKEKMKGSIKEPSLVVCWVIVIIVSMYVVFLLVAGDKDRHINKDEL